MCPGDRKTFEENPQKAKQSSHSEDIFIPVRVLGFRVQGVHKTPGGSTATISG